jgi:hypothetical protein
MGVHTHGLLTFGDTWGSVWARSPSSAATSCPSNISDWLVPFDHKGGFSVSNGPNTTAPTTIAEACAHFVSISGAESVRPDEMGRYVKVMVRDGRPIYSKGSKFLHFWPNTGWLVADGKVSNSGWLFSREAPLCPSNISNWSVWLGSTWSIAYDVVAKGSTTTTTTTATTTTTVNKTSGSVIVQTTITGVKFDLLTLAHKEALKDKGAETFATSFNVSKSQASVALSKGSVVMTVTIQPKQGQLINPDAVPTPAAIVLAVKAVPNIATATEPGVAIGATAVLKLTGPFRMYRAGHCSQGWLGIHEIVANIDACHELCSSNLSCGYFAYRNTDRTCATYKQEARCPDDRRFPD